jgi:hypothetical protein
MKLPSSRTVHSVGILPHSVPRALSTRRGLQLDRLHNPLVVVEIGKRVIYTSRPQATGKEEEQ